MCALLACGAACGHSVPDCWADHDHVAVWASLARHGMACHVTATWWSVTTYASRAGATQYDRRPLAAQPTWLSLAQPSTAGGGIH
jgi:hypothetical protein